MDLEQRTRELPKFHARNAFFLVEYEPRWDGRPVYLGWFQPCPNDQRQVGIGTHLGPKFDKYAFPCDGTCPFSPGPVLAA